MNLGSNREKKDLKSLDETIEEVIVDAYGDDEQRLQLQGIFEG